jgi:hypothetical protein
VPYNNNSLLKLIRLCLTNAEEKNIKKIFFKKHVLQLFIIHVNYIYIFIILHDPISLYTMTLCFVSLLRLRNMYLC